MPDVDPAARAVPVPAPLPSAKRPRVVFAGYTAPQLLFALAVLAVAIWGMWVTRAITTKPAPQRIVKADLSRIVGDYVQAQSRSATPPDQVQFQMRQFMASLDNELQRRGAEGQVVLVGEAVLSKSVPDITPDVVRAVYSSGIKRPQPASPGEMNRMLGALQQAPVQATPGQAQPVPMIPAAAAAAPLQYQAPAMTAPVDQTYGAPAGPNVSTFGGSSVPGLQ